MYSAKHTNKRNANEKPYTLRASECVKNTEIECTWIKAIACACVKPWTPFDKMFGLSALLISWVGEMLLFFPCSSPSSRR